MKRVYELDVYTDQKDPLPGMASLWFKPAEYKAIIEKLGPKLNVFINSTKA